MIVVGSLARGVGLLAMVMVVAVRMPLTAQSLTQIAERTWPVDSVLSRFEADVRANTANGVGENAVARIIDLASPYSARKDSLLNGLERLAVTHSDRYVRQAATLWIASAGEVGRTAPPVRGVWPRLLRIYRSNTAWVVRSTILDQSPMLVERPSALALLRSVAAEQDTTTPMGPEGYFGFGDLRIAALSRLAEMGEEGRAVLQAMHRSGEARSPQARMILDDMARRGFPVRDIALDAAGARPRPVPSLEVHRDGQHIATARAWT